MTKPAEAGFVEEGACTEDRQTGGVRGWGTVCASQRLSACDRVRLRARWT